jgi:mRNA interferase MazF
VNPPTSLRAGEIVLIVFPFTDLSGQKLRPALILSAPAPDEFIVAFITSRMPALTSATAHTISLNDPEFAATGLKVASTVRLDKLATLHRSLIRRRLGQVGPSTERAIAACLRNVFHQL